MNEDSVTSSVVLNHVSAWSPYDINEQLLLHDLYEETLRVRKKVEEVNEEIIKRSTQPMILQLSSEQELVWENGHAYLKHPVVLKDDFKSSGQ